MQLYRLFLIFFLTLPLFSNFAKAQNEVNSTTIINPNIDYNKTQHFILGGINIEPLKGYDDDVLRSTAGINDGDLITLPEGATDILNRYWKQGLFSDVKVLADSIVGTKIYLHIYLQAHPRIAKITWNGVKKSEQEDIEKRLGLAVGNQITPNIIDRTKTIIKRYYEEKGYQNVAINIQQKDDVLGDNKVLIDIDINKHQKIKVKHIYITGITDPKQINKLKRAMKKTKENTLINFFVSKKFIPKLYNEDKNFLIDKLNEWGYRDAVILKDSIIKIDDKHVNIYLDLEKGNKYYIRNIDWVGNTRYNTEALQQMLNMKKGDVYNQTQINNRLNKDEDAVATLYYNNGYVFSRITPVELNTNQDSIDLEIRVTEGQPATIKNVRILGNDRVYENVIRRELRTKPGDLFNRESLVRTIRELASMQFFDPEKLQSGLEVKPDEANSTVDINYNLTTKSTDQFEISAGWGNAGIVGKIGVRFTNFSFQDLFGVGGRKRGGIIPQGDGQTLSISAQSNGQYYQSYNISFLEPWFGGKRPNQFQVSTFYSKQSGVNANFYNQQYYNNMYNYYSGIGMTNNYGAENFYDPDKYIQMFGASIGYGTRLRWPDDYFSFMAQLAYTRYMMRNWNYFLFSNGSSNSLNLTLTLSRNSADNPFFPRRGSEFMVSVSATPPHSLWDKLDHKNLASNRSSLTYAKELQDKYRWLEYHKWKFKLRTYTALTSKAKTPVISTRFEGGFLGYYNPYNKSPFETFYVGGDGMSGYTGGYATETIGLRGYDNGSLTPPGFEAYAYTRLSLELRYPLLLEGSTQIFVHTFAEGGNAWANLNNFSPFNLKRSAGFGVRLFLPMVGLMGVDWAYGFDTVFGNKGGSHFHFVIGQEF